MLEFKAVLAKTLHSKGEWRTWHKSIAWKRNNFKCWL